MSNVELLEVMIIFTMLWYAGMAIIENSKNNKKPMATRRKK
jgi:hypothetical protein